MESSIDNTTFTEVPDKKDFSFPKEEEKILEFWDEIDAFKTQLKLSEGRKLFTFYDGPPFATGLPHYGHILAGTIKDVVTRYACSTGHYVERRFGWDTHGLPVEHEIDQKLHIKSREDVLRLGIDVYNEECRKIVMRYANEWESIVKRCGRWIDFKNDYKTLDTTFMESIWNVFKTIYEKGLVYRGYKVMPYSTHLNTPLSNFEAGLNYKDVSDPSVVVSFPLVGDESKAFLAWTTTPWTLPSNLALCVNKTYDYVTIKDKETGAIWILAKARVAQVYTAKQLKKKKNLPYEILDECKGDALEGQEYVPLFNYFDEKREHGAFKVLCDDYVTIDSGTGIVHQAPGFGEDDYRVCLKYGIIKKNETVPCPVNENGCFAPEITDFSGMHVKRPKEETPGRQAGENGDSPSAEQKQNENTKKTKAGGDDKNKVISQKSEADEAIKKNLKERGRLIRVAAYKHSYPFCWRSETPLIYKAVPSWFVNVTSIKDKLVANNFETYWVPENIQKRFHNWLAGARDWAISRNRYWGTPLPIWMSEDGEEIVVVGSVAELEELTGAKDINDLHRHKIDHLTIPSKEGRGTLRRIDEVFDCWFESGSMPYGQVHYPFERKDDFHEIFPADFIAEGLDQTRGWFYTLMVLSTALLEKPTFKNLIVNGLVLAEDGKKMSKRLKNYPDPSLILNEYGADALRLCLINSPVVRAKEMRFSKKAVKAVINDVFLIWLNTYKFFVENATRYELYSKKKFVANSDIHEDATNIMDRWILSKLETLVKNIREEMGGNTTRENYMEARKAEYDDMLKKSNLAAAKGGTGSVDVDQLASEGEEKEDKHKDDDEVLDAATGKKDKDELHLGYRLYKVVPELVKFLISLSKWYVRLNRPRLRGQEGVDNSLAGLQTMHHVLLWLSRLMAPFTPFLAEEMYQNLKRCLSENERGESVEESVHYTLLPEVNEEARHEDIEVAVIRMQSAIVLGRRARDTKKIPTRRPLSSITVVHPDPAFLQDVEQLRNGVEIELNVHNVEFSSELGAFMKLKCNPRHEIGKRLRRQARAAKDAIAKMTQEQIHELKENGKYDFGEFEVLEEDVEIVFEFTGDEDRYAIASHGQLLVMLDTEESKELVYEAHARALRIGIQSARKETGLKSTQNIYVFYDIDESNDQSAEILEALLANSEFIRKDVRQPVHHISRLPKNAVKFAESKCVVSNVQCTITLTRPCLAFSNESLTAKYKDTHVCDGVKSLMSSLYYSDICKQLTENGGTFDINLNGTDVSVVLNKDVFLSIDDLYG